MWMKVNDTHKMMAVSGAEAGYREAEFQIRVSVSMSLTGKEDCLPSGVKHLLEEGSGKGPPP
jgi:Tfp pilus assembly protein PilX